MISRGEPMSTAELLTVLNFRGNFWDRMSNHGIGLCKSTKNLKGLKIEFGPLELIKHPTPFNFYISVRMGGMIDLSLFTATA